MTAGDKSEIIIASRGRISPSFRGVLLSCRLRSPVANWLWKCRADRSYSLSNGSLGIETYCRMNFTRLEARAAAHSAVVALAMCHAMNICWLPTSSIHSGFVVEKRLNFSLASFVRPSVLHVLSLTELQLQRGAWRLIISPPRRRRTTTATFNQCQWRRLVVAQISAST